MNGVERIAAERVRIVDREHPHYGETGEFRGEVIKFRYWDGKMAKIHLDACQHGTDACYVSPGQIERMKEQP